MQVDKIKTGKGGKATISFTQEDRDKDDPKAKREAKEKEEQVRLPPPVLLGHSLWMAILGSSCVHFRSDFG